MRSIVSHSKAEKNDMSVPLSFSILSWNLHKECHTNAWLPLFQKISMHYHPTFFLFQELDFHLEDPSLYHTEGYHLTFLPNISLPHRKKTLAGLATLSTIDTEDHISFFTQKREPLVRTTKPSLVSRYPLENGMTLLVINIHGINFVRSKHFEEQLGQLRELVYAHRGPAIIGGDFNSWSKRRVEQIEEFLGGIAEQEYEEVTFGASSIHQKGAPVFWQLLFGKHSLDRFYYAKRYLRIDQPTKVLSKIEDKKITFSDHLPLLMHFTVR